MIRVYYDGQCGMCSREINHYKKIAPKDTFEWVDLTSQPERLSEIGLSFQDAMKSFHVLDHQNKRHVGIEGFKIIWNELPNWRWLRTAVDFPGLNFLSRKAYKIFADWRFKHHDYDQCEIKFD